MFVFIFFILGTPKTLENVNSMACVNTIAELKELNPQKALEIIYVMGCKLKNDGGGGFFYYDKDGRLAEDGGTIFYSKYGGFWKRIYEPGTLNVLWFGTLVEDDDWRFPIRRCIEILEKEKGGKIVFPTMVNIKGTLFVSGEIIVPEYIHTEPKIEFNGVGIGGIRYKGPDGCDVIRLGSESKPLNFRLVLKDFNVDGSGKKDIILLNGYSFHQPHNIHIECQNTNFCNFQGDKSIGILCGNITDSRFENCTIQGVEKGGGKGIVPGRSGCQLFNCQIWYCKSGVYLENNAEANIQMFGGQIGYCDHHIVIQGGGYNSNASYFFGTFINETPHYSKLIYIEDTLNTYVASLSFIGCLFASPRSDVPLLEFNCGGHITLLGCVNWHGSKTNKVWAGRYAEIIFFNNTNMILDSLAPGFKNVNRVFSQSGDDVNALGGFKDLLNFYYDNIQPGLRGVPILINQSHRVQRYVMLHQGSVLGISAILNNKLEKGFIEIQLERNGLSVEDCHLILKPDGETKYITIFKKDTFKFTQGDEIGILLWSAPDILPADLSIGVGLFVEY